VVVIAATLAIAVGAFIWGRKLFPAEQAITSLSSYSVNIQEGGSPGALGQEFLSFKRQPGGTIKIQSTAEESFTSAGGNQFLFFTTSLDLLGPHIRVIQCPRQVYCSTSDGPSGPETVIKYSGNSSSSSQQIETAVIRDPSFGFTENSETAVAEIPYINLISLPSVSGNNTNQPTSLTSNPFSLSFSYNIPNANVYDWSLPPLAINSNEVAWEETVNLISLRGQLAELRGAAQASELTGSDHTVQANHNQDTFFAGVVLGIAGAAALAALLEFLHLIFRVEQR
jgi:hypothetical protein